MVYSVSSSGGIGLSLCAKSLGYLLRKDLIVIYFRKL